MIFNYQSDKSLFNIHDRDIDECLYQNYYTDNEIEMDKLIQSMNLPINKYDEFKLFKELYQKIVEFNDLR